MDQQHMTLETILKREDVPEDAKEGIRRSISAHEQALEVLKESESRYRTLFSSAKEGIMILDSDNGLVVDVNSHLVEMLGYAHEQIKGKAIWELGFLKEVVANQDKFLEFQRQEHIRYESLPLETADGRHINVEFVSNIYLMDPKKIIQCNIRDITKRKEAEDALRENQAQLNLALQSADMGMWYWDITENKRYFDDRVCHLLGINPATFTGTVEEFYGAVHPDDRERIKASLARTIEQDMIYEPEYRAVWPDGSIHHITARGGLTRDEKGRPSRVNGIIWDVTKHYQEEEEIRQTNSLLNSIIENIPNTIFVKDARDLTFVRFNKAGEELTGISEEELLLKTDYDFFPKEQADGFTENDREVLRGKKMADIPEELIQTKHQGIRIVHTKKVPILNANGEPEYLLGISEDITEHKQAEQSLQESHEILAKFSEQVPGALYQFKMTPDGKFSIPFASKMMNAVFGFTPSQVKDDASHLFSRIHPDDLQGMYQSINQSGSTMTPWHHEFRVVKPDGAHWVLGDSQPERLADGSIAWYGYVSDITERKHAETELLLEKMRLKAQLDTSPDGVLVVDENGQIVDYNARFGELWKIPQDVLDTGNARSLLKYVKKYLKEPAGFLSKFEHLYQQKEQISSGEINFIDGRCFERYSTSLVDSEGGYHGRIWYFHDITRRMNLERAVVEKERMTAIGELAAGVAHDFNNTLQAMFGSIELASLQKDVSPTVRKYLNTIRSSAKDAAVRVQKIQRFGTKAGHKSEYAAVDLNTLLDQVIEQTRPKWKAETEKNGFEISIRKEYGKAQPVDGNSGELSSAFYNLIKNAIEAMPEGGTLSFETGDAGSGVYTRITDTGIGMGEETVKRIFQPFYTTKGFDLGRGLGMSAVYSTIRDHDGEICVKRSVPGEGTTIEVVLPYARKAEPPLKKTRHEGKLSARVLWVDDDDLIREAGRDMLEILGYQADIAASGEEALQLLEKNRYDLIISDVGMPHMSGWQLAEQITEKYKGSNIALLTGWGADVTDEEREKYGVGHMLGKPIGIEQLENLIREVVQVKT